MTITHHRATRLGASEVASIVWASDPEAWPIDEEIPFASPVAIAARLRGEPVAPLEGDWLYWGSALEPAIVQRWAADRESLELAYPVPTCPHATAPIAATCDAIYRRESWGGPLDDDWYYWPSQVGTLEAKTAGHTGSWRSHVPYRYRIQALTQALCLDSWGWDVRTVWVAALVSGRTYIEHRISRDPDLEARIVESCSAWYARHITAGEPVPIDCHPRTVEAVTQDHADDDVIELDASHEVATMLARYTELRAAARAAQAEVDAAEAAIRQAIGEHYAITCPAGRASLSRQSTYEVIDWAGVARTLGVTDDVTRRHTVQRTRARSFRWTPKKEESK